ncbi:MAG: M23 family metallopeptidase [Balneolaceae bacterium]
MFKAKQFIPLLLIFLLAGAEITRSQIASLPADSVNYLWPTNASHYLSSTFAETRSAHLHAGLDIRTWGREGYDVFATRDGVVYRIGIGPSGYGNVIYLKHKDGSFSVYAHLNRFEPGLQAFADSIRLKDFSFELDKHIADEQITYHQGDVIGYSGSTGVGPPHLHFELRTPDFKPFNPLLTDLKVDDSLPPRFSQMGIEYLNPETLRLEGHSILSANHSGEITDFGKIIVNGPIGLSVNVHDRANRTPNAYAVYSLAMIHESDTLFYSEADHFSYSQAGHMFLDRSYPILAKTRSGFQRLYVVEGNQLPFYKKTEDQGVLTLPDGRYPIRIVASDIYGNRSEAEIEIQFENIKNELRPVQYVPAYPANSDFEGKIITSPSRPVISNDLSLFAAAGEPQRAYVSNEYSGIVNRSYLDQVKLNPNSTLSLNSSDQKLWIRFPKEAIYDTLTLDLTMTNSPESINFSFTPDRLPVQESVYFNYILPDSLSENDKLALFSIDKFRNRLTFMNSVNSHGIISAELKEISSLKLMEDNIAPWVGRPRFDKNLGGNHILVVPVKDNLTKIDYRRSVILINGKRGIVEYDPEDDLLIYYHPEFIPSESNEVEISVYDGVGNKTTRKLTVMFSG